MSDFATTERTQVKRLPKRGHYDRETVHKILDEAFVCHVGFVVDGQPFVIPTNFGRVGDTVYDGSLKNSLKRLEEALKKEPIRKAPAKAKAAKKSRKKAAPKKAASTPFVTMALTAPSQTINAR